MAMRSVILYPVLFAGIAAMFPLAAAGTTGSGNLTLELNKVEEADGACRLTFRIVNRYQFKLEDINVEVYLVDNQGVALQSIQFPFGLVLPGKSRFAKFDIKGLPCSSIGGLFVNEFKSCKGSADMKLECLDGLKTTNLTGLKFNDGD